MTAPRKRPERHGFCGKNATQEQKRMHWVWVQIRQRCRNPANKDWRTYGGIGVRMFKPWDESFLAFWRYLQRALGPKPTPEHSLDRVDPTKGYMPGNLRWATRAEQTHNRRPKAPAQEAA
jgi:hypothetical protein